ncbi:bifunctional 4-hydroxy-2-oxoglutarate aldolase/2-dehydro-3-deoxy-phosphogluconate aldolase [Microbacterium limosum]|uniref:2-dehydro-3-deoxy-phosphogluconate aldolase n=1 Tax=Microbacterium limosum TaxID=3079935 RepID=A0AAU0MG45_9MICO|nr:bifunctional 4-hydroxy-2-oxoglutarate aldolase/2-dehydro-3-deoxy-phosphogluconate aldolase [Microbacterium sp. Y20]WOQ68959.1 bifunctional 4-hydroxy-2-oxoglutarate aldolase/2-dehydro-3-deoxy-phosphogluconate aldolase [Microbacterium sp. Y20]
MSPLLDRLAAHRIVPVVTATTADEGARISAALAEGGLPVAEITFRTAAAAAAIEAASARGDVLIGAGTVIRPDQVDAAVSAGARFIVSPGTSRAVMERCGEHGVPIVPGAVTATEIQAALEHGAPAVKFFPAESSGGAASLRALSAPFADVRFLPTGGISPKNMHDYLAIPSVLAVGGSWMLPPDAVRAGDWDRIVRLTREAVAIAESEHTTALR